jgi:hypothetical protein
VHRGADRALPPSCPTHQGEAADVAHAPRVGRAPAISSVRSAIDGAAVVPDEGRADRARARGNLLS